MPQVKDKTPEKDGYAEDTRRDSQALSTRDELRAQPQVNVYLQWTEDDAANHAAQKALPYPKVEGVNINGVQYWLERGKMREVPLTVACILAGAGKIPWDMVPDTIEGHGEVRDKAIALAEKRTAEDERRRRYASIGEGLLR